MNESLRIRIAHRIAKILEKKGWKQQDLVNASGLTKAYVSQIMHGAVNLTLETIETLEMALNEQIFKV